MDPNTRSGWGLGAQLNTFMIVAIVVPALTMVGLGAYFITQFGQLSPAAPANMQTTFWVVTLVATAVGLVASVVAATRMRFLARNNAVDLAEICRQASAGERGQRASVHGSDEFAALAQAVNALLDGGMVGNVRSGASGSDAPDATILQAQIEKLLQEVSAVGDGDLRVQAEVTPDTLGVLADSFNYMIEELAKVVGRVQATTFQVTNATRRLLDRSAEVANASETQALQISQTSEAVGRLADFVQLSANNALRAADTAREALRTSQAGQQAVVQTIDGMAHIRENVQETAKKIKRLGERSQEVGEIVRLIEDIAEQTNLLALNAAIQSAMAGEHGRGFAVVADEIRILAERVAEATKRVGTLVKGIQGDTYEAVVAMEESTQEVVNGSRLADAAGRSLQSIYGAVERQTQMIADIAQAAGERKSIAEAVAVAMGQIAEVTNQTNSATQETTSQVSYLAELAEQLRASVATFRLSDSVAEAVGLGSQNELGGGMNLPTLGRAEWNNGMRALPALPAGPSSGYANGMNADYNGGYAGGYDGGYDGGFETNFDLGPFGGDAYAGANAPWGPANQAPMNMPAMFSEQDYSAGPMGQMGAPDFSGLENMGSMMGNPGYGVNGNSGANGANGNGGNGNNGAPNSFSGLPPYSPDQY